MSDSFTPLVASPGSGRETAIPAVKVLTQADAKVAFQPLAVAGKPEQPAKACATPSVTLQKQGEVVSGIRIECGCGQVIELACVY
jgi:hypothetical protein